MGLVEKDYALNQVKGAVKQEKKSKVSERIKNDVEKWLQEGNEITYLAPDVFGVVVKPNKKQRGLR